jgi:hypothetical protein
MMELGDELAEHFQTRVACSHNPVTSRNQRLTACERVAHIGCYNGCFVIDFILALLAALRALVRSRADLALEILALRQQVAVLKRKVPRPPLKTHDRLFWKRAMSPMARLEERACDRQAGHGRSLTADRLSLVLALAIPVRPQQTSNRRRTSRPNPSPRRGESRMGGAQDPRRTVETWI